IAQARAKLTIPALTHPTIARTPASDHSGGPRYRQPERWHREPHLKNGLTPKYIATATPGNRGPALWSRRVDAPDTLSHRKSAPRSSGNPFRIQRTR